MSGESRVPRVAIPFMAVVFLCVAPVIASARPVGDYDEVSGWLAQAKTEAVELQRDAEEMNTFMRDKISWQVYAARLDSMKQHVNNMAELFGRISNAELAGPWQLQAVEQTTPLLDEMGGDVTMMIVYLKAAPDRLMFTDFPDYVSAETDVAARMTALISDYVAYGEAKEKSEELEYRLELPPS